MCKSRSPSASSSSSKLLFSIVGGGSSNDEDTSSAKLSPARFLDRSNKKNMLFGNLVASPSKFLFRTFQPPYTKRKIAFLVMFSIMTLLAVICGTLYKVHPGFRRTVQFWKGMSPLVAKYKLLQLKGKIYLSDDEFEARLNKYRQQTAPKLVDLIIRMGGIYVKIGQVMSTIGQGLLPDEYVKALRPLQDGVPPRSYEEVKQIIESSSGQKMEDVFYSFDEVPIGSASIAQAHRATLKRNRKDKRRTSRDEEGEEVIVKIQYPEVRKLFEADLANLEVATKLFAPENMELAKSMRKRHENELDFIIEAENLRECSRNMQAHGVEPSLVRIPRVKNETGLCSENVLVMEYLQGTSLSDAIQDEQNKIARAMGKQDAEELRSTLTKKMREHFENGGGASAPGSGGMEMMSGRKTKMIQIMTPLASQLFRVYANSRHSVENALVSVQNAARHVLSGALINGGDTFENDMMQSPSLSKKKLKNNINLARALKTLIHVHGLQMLKDGCYNADPHPGNVLVLPDGRLGLLDYGMVGRLTPAERDAITQTVVALARKDKAATAKLYRDAGYQVTISSNIHSDNRKNATSDNDDVMDDSILHRFASFHLDKIDLSPLILDNGKQVETLALLRSTRERVVPNWVEQGRRLGGLLQGVSVQAARPISLAKEWEPIAASQMQKSLKNK